MTCFAPDCLHNFGSSGCKLFRFPTDFAERKKWIKAVRRIDKVPTESHRICSCHFVNGKRENGPTIFSWNSKTELPPLPLKKKRLKLRSISKNQILNIPNTTKSKRKTKANRNVKNVIPAYDTVVEENAELRTQIGSLRKKLDELMKPSFGMHCIENNEKLFSYYTGLTREVFNALLDSCSKSPLRYFFGWKIESLNLQDQLLITLMKLRLNLDYIDLSVRFNTNEDTISNIVLTFIIKLHEIFCADMLNETLPEENDVACRMIVGYAEFDTVIPLQTIEEKTTTKKYKNSLKGLIAIDSNGVITHCSQLYSANTSDKMIMKRSGIVSKYKNTKLIFIEEGPVTDGVLSIDDSEAYARTIKRLRYFGILNFIPKPLFVHSSKIFQLCIALTNLVNPELKQGEKSDGAGLDVKEECGLDDYDTFVDCTKIEIKEEVDLGVESIEYADDIIENFNCENESEDEVIMEYDLDLDEIL